MHMHPDHAMEGQHDAENLRRLPWPLVLVRLGAALLLALGLSLLLL